MSNVVVVSTLLFRIRLCASEYHLLGTAGGESAAALRLWASIWGTWMVTVREGCWTRWVFDLIQWDTSYVLIKPHLNRESTF